MGTKTARVEQTIREWIASGKLAPGDKLPSERTMAADESLGIGRTALRQVLAKLVNEGVLEVRHGGRYHVPDSAIGPATPTVEAPGPLEPWQIHGERTVYDNRWVKLALVDVEPPNVERFEHHVVRLHHVAITVVIDDQDRVLMMWRYRFVPDRWGWELPGGIVEDGEDASVTAVREVEEETGWRPRKVEHAITYQPMIGMVDSPHDIFVGHGADHVGDPSDAEEAGHIAWVPLADIPVLMARDELMGSGTLVGLLHVLASRGTQGFTASP
ncbi:NUDIX domain-containing protein [Streptantibioticus parmotrematis]|uniref:NUDIX domain-containing protein n=1 Tax=Streptantibioticus parmotrematis TaxID=2873249 RepID=UPI0033C57316